MKKFLLMIFVLVTVFGLGICLSASYAAKPVDNDGDGCKSNVDCDDNDASVCALNCLDQCAAPPPPDQCPGGATCADYTAQANCDADCKCEWSNKKGGTCKDLVPDTCGGGTEDTAALCSDTIDNDNDSLTDCADPDCAAFCTPATEDTAALCSDTIDNDNDSLTDCADPDCDAFCSGPENCIDGIDNDSDGKTDCADSDCSTEPSCVNPNHSSINQYDGPQTCLGCHSQTGNQMLNSVHGSWFGATPNVTNIQGSTGKWGQTNNYCTDPEMAEYACLKCHVSLVYPPTSLTANDMDCMQCHQANYAATFMPDPATATDYTSCVDGSVHTYMVPSPEADGKMHKVIRFDLLDPPANEIELARTVTLPTNKTCLMPCHAAAGGGDGTKRGDLSSDMVDPAVSMDVHLSSSGLAQLTCTSCHVATNHQIPGRGNDLRPEDTGATMKTCVDCHVGMDSGGGHASAGKRSEPDRHVARVDCTGCHIDAYGKGVGTEVSRDWTVPHWNAGGCEGQGAYVGEEVRGTNLTPEYRFWNGKSWVFDRDGTEGLKIDPVDDGLAMSYPNGDINDGKLYPFKIHTSVNPVNDSSGKTNFDVLQMFMTGCYDDAAIDGLAYAGETGSYTWTENKAFQLITHGIAPAASADDCAKCHENDFEADTTTKLDKLGYSLIDADASGAIDDADRVIVCGQCHNEKGFKRNWEQMHNHLTKGRSGTDTRMGCAWCHDFRRSERDTDPLNPICDPCDTNCSDFWQTGTPWTHTCP